MWQITSWTVNTGSKSTRTTQFLWFTSVWFSGAQLDIWVNTQQAVWSVDGRKELNNYWWFHQSHTLVWVWFGFGNCGLPSTPWLRETLFFSGLGGTGQGRNHSLTVTPEPDSVSEKQETGCALPPWWCAAGRCTFTEAAGRSDSTMDGLTRRSSSGRWRSGKGACRRFSVTFLVFGGWERLDCEGNGFFFVGGDGREEGSDYSEPFWELGFSVRFTLWNQSELK